MTDTTDAETDRLLARMVRRLTDDYDGFLTPAEVDRISRDSFGRLRETARITTFLPMLAERLVRAFARQHAGRRLHIRTGGSNPGEQIHPAVVTAMAELGVGLEEAFPKPLTDEVLAAADVVVVTMGCGDACPVLPGRRYEDWAIEDPATGTAAQVRVIRDDIEARVRRLLAELLPDLATTPLAPPRPSVDVPDPTLTRSTT